MSAVNVLMVEDDQGQQNLYEDAIDEFNKKNIERTITLDIVDSSADAISKLNEKDYAAVFLDLILKGDRGKGPDASGNAVLKHILNNNKLRLIVYVVSGTLHSLSNDFDDIFENPLMRKFDRSEDTNRVLEDLVRVLDTGVTKILGGSGQLDTLINNIFFHHLAKGFHFWESKGRDCEKELLRYTASHLLEYLDAPMTEEDGEPSYFNPEFYIYPPIKKPVATGDIISLDDDKYILLSPSCDIAPRIKGENTIYNVEAVVLAKIIPLSKRYFDDRKIPYSSSGKTSDKAWEGFLNNHRNNSPKQRYHYMPEYLDIVESLIDFKGLINVPLEDILKAERIATISTPFIRDVQSRFSAYFGRQGQPSGEWSV